MASVGLKGILKLLKKNASQLSIEWPGIGLKGILKQLKKICAHKFVFGRLVDLCPQIFRSFGCKFCIFYSFFSTNKFWIFYYLRAIATQLKIWTMTNCKCSCSECTPLTWGCLPSFQVKIGEVSFDWITRSQHNLLTKVKVLIPN